MMPWRQNSIATNLEEESKGTASSGSKMKRTPFGAPLTPALTGCPPAVTRIDQNIRPEIPFCQHQWAAKTFSIMQAKRQSNALQTSQSPAHKIEIQSIPQRFSAHC